jgi:hypothetical protein
MLSADMMRYVQLHHAAGFKFRTQHQMLTSFVVFAEQHGDEFVRVDRAIEWAARAPSAPPYPKKDSCGMTAPVGRFRRKFPTDRYCVVAFASELSAVNLGVSILLLLLV